MKDKKQHLKIPPDIEDIILPRKTLGVSAVSVARHEHHTRTNSNHDLPSRNLLLETCPNNYRSPSHMKNSATTAQHSQVTVASQ
jgi:hypothetical protein